MTGFNSTDFHFDEGSIVRPYTLLIITERYMFFNLVLGSQIITSNVLRSPISDSYNNTIETWKLAYGSSFGSTEFTY